jgi:hypothetical protein
LSVKIFHAGINFVLLRLSIIRRAALDDVTDKHLFPREIYCPEDLGKQLACSTYKWPAGLILSCTGTLPHHH